MGWMPGAVRSPFPTPGRARRRKGRGVAYHVAVSEAESLRPWPGADWHFYVSKKGTIYQFIDTDLQSWTTGAGNSSMIGVETEGGVHNPETEPWTDAQLDALARIARWAHETEGIPLRLMKSSHPSERGLGWHKLGVRPWVVPGGELWSSAYGKICPGRAKIAQMPEVLRRAQGTDQEDDMNAEQAKQLEKLYEVYVTGTHERIPKGLGRWVPITFLRATEEFARRLHREQVPALEKRLAGLQAAVDKLATVAANGDEVTADQLRAVVREEMAKVVRVEVSVDDDTPA